MNLLGRGGKEYILENKPFAQGGEGMIFDIVGIPDKVAKIYKTGLATVERELKLNVMISKTPNQNVLNQIAWPLDVLYEGNKFVGFIMPKLELSEELNVIYEYGSTAKYPDIPWSNKITIAKNLCAVLNAIHETGNACGDLNPKNISVNPFTGYVVFVDTDSYHIIDDKNTYRCEVGMPEYLPSEIHKKMKTGLRDAELPTFGIETDNFALAVHIFQLLMNGVHPFSCAVLPSQASVAYPQPSDNIINGEFPFMMDVKGVTIPRFAPEINILPNHIQDLFKRAFIDGHNNPGVRPDSKEWYEELSKLEKELKKCSKNKTHEYYNKLKKCPWCDADDKFNFGVNSKTITQTIITAPSMIDANSIESGEEKRRRPKGNILAGFVLLVLLLGICAGLIWKKNQYNFNSFAENNISEVYFYNQPNEITIPYGEWKDNSFPNLVVVNKQGNKATAENSGKYIINRDKLNVIGKQIIEFKYLGQKIKLNVNVVPLNLKAPSTIRIDGTTIEWDGSNYASYLLKINNDPEIEIYNNRYSLTDDYEAGMYNIRIKLVSSNNYVISSDWSKDFFVDKLSAVENVQINDGKLTFDYPDSKFNTIFKIYNHGKLLDTVSGMQYNLTNKLDEGINIITVMVSGNGVNSMDSSNSEKITVSRLHSPSGLDFNNYKLKWNGMDGAIGYGVFVAEVGRYFDSTTNSIDLIGELPKGAYKVSVYAKGNGKEHIDSNTTEIDIEIEKEVTKISNSNGLRNINNDLEGFYVLSQDIDLSNVENFEPLNEFKGLLDGRGFSINNLTIKGSKDNIGLFSINKGTIKNLVINNADITSQYIKTNAGILVGRNEGEISNVEVNGNINTPNYTNVGGIAGYVLISENDKLNNNKNTASVQGLNNVGGIVGFTTSIPNENYSTSKVYTISNNINEGRIEGNNNVGGIFGAIQGGNQAAYNREYSYFQLDTLNNSGEIVSKGDYAGGILGLGIRINSLVLSTNTANVSGGNYTGGFVGSSEKTNIKSAINNNKISGKAYVGGIAGKAGVIEDSTNDGEIISTAVLIVDKTSYAYVGGIAGYAEGLVGNINNSNIDVSTGGVNVGGIAGYVLISESDKLNNNKNTASVQGLNNVGGIVGFTTSIPNENYSTSKVYTISNNINEGRIEGNNNVGGIFGAIQGGNQAAYNREYSYFQVMYSANTGNIIGNNKVGGVIGSYLRIITDYYVINTNTTTYGKVLGE